MADTHSHVLKRKLFYYDSSDSDNGDKFDSDDSVKDKDYVESESSSSSSQDSSDQVRKEKCGLSPFSRIFCGLSLKKNVLIVLCYRNKVSMFMIFQNTLI